jgi:hypothetical protein
MTDMVRKQIYITRRQQALLKQLSQQLGLSEAEIIRQAIDREAVVGKNPLPGSGEQSWQEALNFMRSLRDRSHLFKEPYRWNREELYEERMNRYSPRTRDER